MRALLLLLFLVFQIGLNAQDKVVFNYEDFIALVKAHHPAVKQARIKLEQRKKQVGEARGAFDPELYSLVKQKYFDEKNYYNTHASGLKIPTWFGVSLDANYQNNSGLYLNPENSNPESGLWSAGIAANIGNGLFIDKRRASLRQAQFMLKASDAEMKEQLNSLYFDAIAAYWDWVVANKQFDFYKSVCKLSDERRLAVVKSYQLGANASIDTLEAFIQAQKRFIDVQEAEIAQQNAALLLSNFLWSEDGFPLEITSTLVAPEFSSQLIPKVIKKDSVDLWQEQLIDLQPKLNQFQYKLESLNIKRRLAAEELKPKLKLKYNFLQGNTSPIVNAWNTDNYTWGLEFSYPLFLRTERAKYKIAKLSQEQGALEYEQMQLAARNKLQALWFKQEQYFQLKENYSELSLNRAQLLKGEKTKFDMGESSLFLLNSRESKFIESQVKLLDAIGKYLKARAALLQHIGKLGSEL